MPFEPFDVEHGDAVRRCIEARREGRAEVLVATVYLELEDRGAGEHDEDASIDTGLKDLRGACYPPAIDLLPKRSIRLSE